MFRFMNKETGKFLVSSAPTVPSPYLCNDYRFTWSKNGHFYRNIEMVKRTAKRLQHEGIKFEIINYDENTLGAVNILKEIE